MTWTGGSFGSRAACVLAPNASMMTLDGTNTWVLREPDARRSIVVDPGPSVLAHLDAVADAAGEVGVVLLTHHHADHSEAAREFAERMGCGVRALDPAYRLGSEGLGDGDVVAVDGLEVRVVATPGHTADSLSFLLPAERAVLTGDTVLGRGTTVVAVDGLEVRVVATPGHTADSLSFLLPAERAVLTGDTVLGRGTTVVAHPDGQLGAYLDSLDRLHALAEEHEVEAIWPGHGPVIEDALGALDFYVAHRRERLSQVEAAVEQLARDAEGPVGDDLPRRVVEIVYRDVDPVLWGAAELSVRAQLAYLSGRR
jgi:glyoxylase-like metal-dependent hydrolase (beta-lactamase superfamily II)